MESRIVMTAFVGLLAAAAGCGDDSSDGDGNVTIVIEAEETITEGLESGDCEECITDGSSASFSKYVISIGLVDMAQVDGANPQMGDIVAVADFTNLLETGSILEEFNDIPIGQYAEFGYQTPLLTSDAENINQVSEADITNMMDNDLTYIIEGRLTRDSDGATLDFLIEANVPSVYFLCGEEGLPAGINVSTSGTNALTMHGDHIFFNGFPADESAVQRLAAWMWMVEDTNNDSRLTRVDFEAATDIGTLYPSPPYSDLNAGPAGTVENAWDFIRSQLGTQGHLNGEGECQWRF